MNKHEEQTDGKNTNDWQNDRQTQETDKQSDKFTPKASDFLMKRTNLSSPPPLIYGSPIILITFAGDEEVS